MLVGERNSAEACEEEDPGGEEDRVRDKPWGVAMLKQFTCERKLAAAAGTRSGKCGAFQMVKTLTREGVWEDDEAARTVPN